MSIKLCCFFVSSPQKFTDFEEVPIISTENDLGDGYEDDILGGGGDEQPPPIPPRLGSLNLKKPLPTIPNSESFNDFTNANANNISSSITTTSSSINASATKDATNNLINNEKSASDHQQPQQQQQQPDNDNSLNSSLNSRPLPPIPHQGSNSLDKVNESESEISSSDEYELEDDKYDEDESSGVNGKVENNNSNSNGNTADDNILNGLNGNTDPQNEEFDSKSFAEG